MQKQLIMHEKLCLTQYILRDNHTSIRISNGYRTSAPLNSNKCLLNYRPLAGCRFLMASCVDAVCLRYCAGRIAIEGKNARK